MERTLHITIKINIFPVPDLAIFSRRLLIGKTKSPVSLYQIRTEPRTRSLPCLKRKKKEKRKIYNL